MLFSKGRRVAAGRATVTNCNLRRARVPSEARLAPRTDPFGVPVSGPVGCLAFAAAGRLCRLRVPGHGGREADESRPLRFVLAAVDERLSAAPQQRPARFGPREKPRSGPAKTRLRSSLAQLKITSGTLAINDRSPADCV